MQPRSTLAPLSVLMKGEVLPAFSRWSGIPTKPVETMPPVNNVAGVLLRGLEAAMGLDHSLAPPLAPVHDFGEHVRHHATVH